MPTYSRIHALPLHLANQIAAGEVIERPASVVKELIENSLDAGASDVTLDIEKAGNGLIKVGDNGTGIHRDDLALALSRHATSKLNSSEQLNKIASLGFRGEALPSIASISKLTLSSRQEGDEHGWQILPDTEEASPVVHPIGSTVEVRELFFNLPARKRFLRADKTELNHINNTFNRLALSRFEISFAYQQSAHNRLKLPAAHTEAQRLKRIAKLCGKSFAENCIYIEQDYDGIKLSGWLGNAAAHRPQTDVQYFFINGRVIRDRIINHAIRQAYSEYIPAERFPAFVLYLSLPLDRVDVNVHPTKHEVRFRDARLIHGLLHRAVQDVLLHPANQPHNKPVARQTDSNASLAHTDQVTEQHADYDVTPNQPKSTVQSSYLNPQSPLLFQRYLIQQSERESVIIDLQKADLMLRQQQFRDAASKHNLSVRPVLVPIKLQLDTHLLTNLKNHAAQLNTFGFQFTFDEHSVTLNTIASLYAQANLIDLVTKLAELLTENHQPASHLELLIDLMPTRAIHTTEQADAILQQLSNLETSTVWYRSLNSEDIAQFFTQ